MYRVKEVLIMLLIRRVIIVHIYFNCMEYDTSLVRLGRLNDGETTTHTAWRDLHEEGLPHDNMFEIIDKNLKIDLYL